MRSINQEEEKEEEEQDEEEEEGEEEAEEDEEEDEEEEEVEEDPPEGRYSFLETWSRLSKNVSHVSSIISNFEPIMLKIKAVCCPKISFWSWPKMLEPVIMAPMAGFLLYEIGDGKWSIIDWLVHDR